MRMNKFRNDFPLYRNYPDLVYLDYAATTFMPDPVIEAWLNYHRTVAVSHSRGCGFLADRAIQEFESSREILCSFFGARDEYEFVFGKNATECLNMLAYGLESHLSPGEIILMSPYEHHSNLLPWQMVARKTGACLLQIPMDDEGGIDYSFLDNVDCSLIKVISVSLVSNVNGHEFNIDRLRDLVNSSRAFLIIDVSQAVGHRNLDFCDLKADAYVMSAHKMYGPKNIGAAFIHREFMDRLAPFIYGGGMVWDSMGADPIWHRDWRKFVAGTFDVGLVVAWSKACRYLMSIGMDMVVQSDLLMWNYFQRCSEEYGLLLMPGGSVYSSLCSFRIPGLHSHDIESLVGAHRIEIRCGHLCAQNMLNDLGVTSLCRVSWGIGSCTDDIDRLLEVIKTVYE